MSVRGFVFIGVGGLELRSTVRVGSETLSEDKSWLSLFLLDAIQSYHGGACFGSTED